MANELHPVVTIPRDPILVAELTAALIRADARTGRTSRPAAVRYVMDTARQGNLLRSPEETAKIGVGQCFDLTRAEGAFLGTHVGCIRTPLGLHVFLAFLTGGDPIVYDLSKLRGMDDEPDYAGAAYAPIWPGGGGPAQHAVPPAHLAPSRPYMSAFEKIGGYTGSGQAIGAAGQAGGPRIVPKGSCPGSCAIPQRRMR